jgi:hypothetical protein
MNRELNAILTVIAIDYEVTIKINNIDIGITGKKSESLKLFGKNNPTMPVLPEDMKNHTCLQDGDNSIFVHYKRVDDTSSPELIIELQAREQFVSGANVFAKKEKIELGQKKEFIETFSL